MPIHPYSPLVEMHQRDYAALMVLQGLLANPSESFRTTLSGKDHKLKSARMAYRFADAMIAVSNEKLSEDESEE